MNLYNYELWLWYGREQFLKILSYPKWISTNDQDADSMTNAFDKTKFQTCPGLAFTRYCFASKLY